MSSTNNINGKDFFNTFALTTPERAEAGRGSKQFPSLGEAFFFKGEPGSHVIETSLGRIGVGIYFDAHTIQIRRLVSEQSIDLMLIPHSHSIPATSTKDVSKEDIAKMKNNLQDMAPYYSRLLAIPAVSVNKCDLARALKSEGYIFPGLVTTVDSDRTILARMEEQKGFIAATVTLDPSRKIHASPRAYGRCVNPGLAGRVLFEVVESLERLWYTLSSDRRRSAQAALASSTEQLD